MLTQSKSHSTKLRTINTSHFRTVLCGSFYMIWMCAKVHILRKKSSKRVSFRVNVANLSDNQDQLILYSCPKSIGKDHESPLSCRQQWSSEKQLCKQTSCKTCRLYTHVFTWFMALRDAWHIQSYVLRILIYAGWVLFAKNPSPQTQRWQSWHDLTYWMCLPSAGSGVLAGD